jgi:hypothetical protein
LQQWLLFIANSPLYYYFYNSTFISSCCCFCHLSILYVWEAAAIFLTPLYMIGKQLLLFFANSPLSSPLLSIFFADDEIVKVHSFYGNIS